MARAEAGNARIPGPEWAAMRDPEGRFNARVEGLLQFLLLLADSEGQYIVGTLRLALRDTLREALQDAYDAGYDAGYEDGDNEGYHRGYEDGWAMSNINDQIRNLQQEAGAAGDESLVAVCDDALAGDVLARARCAEVINSLNGFATEDEANDYAKDMAACPHLASERDTTHTREGN